MAQQQWPIKPKHTRLKIAAAAVVLSVAIACGFLIYIWVDSRTQSYFGPGPIEVKVAPDKPFFIQGEKPEFTITVINNQSWPVSHPSLQVVNITRGNETIKSDGMFIDYGKIPTYPANSSTLRHWTWFEPKKDNQTIPHEPGNYTLIIYLQGSGYDAYANCTFKIR